MINNVYFFGNQHVIRINHTEKHGMNITESWGAEARWPILLIVDSISAQ